MRRSLVYTPRQNSGWDTTSQDYQAHLSRMERSATMIPGAPQYPNVHKAFNNKVEFPEEDQCAERSPTANSRKKVQVVEHAETVDEATLDSQADGYIQQKHKAFELCKWKTFKMH
ncbi:hypothetical protein E1A91_A03G072600v1 [Gossypium mustelinum]|uniref:Uncharacterized protein n=3 Tax=Gossypium TaxID=3633 RepID=A0ABR0R5W9_GOSAR|nr:hypothetical protein PVK06_002808 [Gossypium arboreum]TYI35442.1 hypothetical protein ES332_A03G076800v1 [Gossypium tomentosum]TYJ42203.1 hypothetical protein E1A91_A03G072600v1 [Gossypium mustelinum]